MAASGKFDPSSSNPDKPLYASGRGPYTAASLDRSSSFREDMENPTLSALPSMSRSTSSVTQGDAMSFLQCLRFDTKAIVVDHKFNRPGEFKRLAGLALGVPPDESPSGSSKGKLASSSPEELKRFKHSLRESTTKARERVKIFNEGLSVMNKCFPSIPSRKRSRSDVLSGERSRSDVLSGERSNSLFSSDRSVLGATGVGKLGAQTHSIASGFELEQQKPEERTKNAIPNKRTRTSMVDPRMDVRPNTPARTPGNTDRDREGLRLPNSSAAAQGDDRTLPIIGVDGWEKSKMKKKRSGIKADVASGSVATKPIDGYREPKQGMQPRILSDAPRSRLNDPYGFRPGGTNGIVGVVKGDGNSLQTGLAMGRSSNPRSDQDSSPVLHERRERTINSDKERLNSRAVNKSNTREEFGSSSPTTSSSKLNALARAPRSGSSIVPKLSPVIQRATAANDWELSHSSTSKNTAAVGASNRKRTSSARSSSPPVAQWASQRPQKMSRTARRTNFVPIVSSNDKIPSLDTISDVAGNENASVFPRRMSSNSPQQVKLKGDHFPSPALSESEESGPAEVKYRDKGKKPDEIEDKSGLNVQKVSALVLPPRKNKVAGGDDLGDGIRRQGRTGRVFTSTRSLMPLPIEKHGNMGTAKQLRSAKLGLDKTESKLGRPPTRKLTDRKPYTRQKHTTLNAAADFLDDGHEELLAAANAVTNHSYAISSPFWRLMEPLFGSISDIDMAYLKQQVNLGSTAATPNPAPLDSMLYSEIGITETKYAELSPEGPEHLGPGIRGVSSEVSLCQILLSALISEDENEEPCCSENEELEEFNIYGSERGLDRDIEFDDAFSNRQVQSFNLGGRTTFNGYRISASGRSYNELEHNLSDKDVLSKPDTWIRSGLDHSQNGFLPDQAVIPVLSCSDFEYNKMSLSERALLEIQSIGLSPEPVPDLAQTRDEEISREVSSLKDKHHEQVCRKKDLVDRLLKSSLEARELQEKEFERSALDKLVGMAYLKYMSCWGPNAPGGKSTGSKMAKQAALAFVRRTLERCHEFEITGKSCFNEPLFREMFLSRSSQFSDAQQIDASTDGESGKLYANGSAPVGTLQSPSVSNHDIYSFRESIGQEDTWSNRVKKRELLLDDVVGGVVGPTGIGTSLTSNAKGKRSERDRDGKTSSREVLSRNGTTKIGRTASGNVKGERKTKSKPKQKTTQLSAVTGDIGRMSEQPKTTLSSIPKPGEISSSGSGKEKDNYNLSDNTEDLDLHMDTLDVPDLGNQGEDIGSWLNIDDDGMQDHDFMGLEIPMDDLSDLNMMV